MMTKRIDRLRNLARKGKTQSQAARALGVSRQRVYTMSRDYGIRFAAQTGARKSPICSRCDYRKNGSRCLRCKWTPSRIKKLRRDYGLSQVRMSYEVLDMNVWTFTRWENSVVRPSRSSLGKLEVAEKGKP